MNWLECRVDTAHAGLDAVTDLLEGQGVTGLIIDDETDFHTAQNGNKLRAYIDSLAIWTNETYAFLVASTV